MVAFPRGVLGFVRVLVVLQCLRSCSSTVTEAMPEALLVGTVGTHGQFVRSEQPTIPNGFGHGDYHYNARRGQRGRIDFVTGVASSSRAENLDDVGAASAEMAGRVQNVLAIDHQAREINYPQSQQAQHPQLAPHYPAPSRDTEEQRVAAASSPEHFGIANEQYPHSAYPNSPIPPGQCMVPMWSKTDYVCDESGRKDVGYKDSDGLERVGYKDSDGLERRVMEDNEKCTVICPGKSWWREPSVLSMTCKNGVWRNGSSKATAISCKATRKVVYGCYLFVILCFAWIAYHFYVRKKNKEAELASAQQEHHEHHEEPAHNPEPSTDVGQQPAPAQDSESL